jgi:phenylpropionate dioxygenase-like ring-hydroxylating dioxygenase large terminal subunit
MAGQNDSQTFLRNAWYICALSDEVTSKPLARRLLDEPVVLYRTLDGSCVGLADRCCHRGVPLSLGKVIDDCIQCAYHGFTFDRTGRCVRVPSQKSAPAAAHVRNYPLLERCGFVWIWMGGAALPQPEALLDLDEIATAGWTSIRGVLAFQADYRRVIDNILDLSHVSFVHRSTFGSDDATAELDFHEVNGAVVGVRTGPPMSTPPMYRTLGFGQRIRQTKRMTYELPCHVKVPIENVDVDGHPARSATVYIFNSVTPETQESCHYFWISARNFAVDELKVSELIREQTLRAFSEDRLIIEAEQKSHLEGFTGGTAVRADRGGALARRLLHRRILQESRLGRASAPRSENTDTTTN